MVDHGCSTEQIATEMMLRWGYRPRQAWRHAHGWTQDEAAARYNQALNSPQSPMTGKRISDYEAWPVGGVKPTLNALSVLAQVYSTKTCLLVDFIDREAMSQKEQISLNDGSPADNRITTISRKPSIDLSEPPEARTAIAAAPQYNVKKSSSLNNWIRVGDILDLIFEQYAGYTRCYLDILGRDTYHQREIEDLLVILNGVIKKFVCADSGWIDVMIPVASIAEGAVTNFFEGLSSTRGWLQILFSGVRRTTRPVVVPIEVNGIPWRGSANAYASSGIDYVGSFRGLYTGPEYDLPPDLAQSIERRYDYWRRECHFGALLAVAILAPEKEPPQAVGVLNVNFGREHPIGLNDTLEPQQSLAIINILEPALRVLANAIDKHSLRRFGAS